MQFVRTVLGLDAKYYGGAESALAVATILGSVAAGLLTGKLKFVVYGFLFDRFSEAIWFVLIPTGILIWAVGFIWQIVLGRKDKGGL